MSFKVSVNEGFLNFFRKQQKKIRLSDVLRIHDSMKKGSIKSIYFYLLELVIDKNRIKPEKDYLTPEEVEKRFNVTMVLRDEKKALEHELSSFLSGNEQVNIHDISREKERRLWYFVADYLSEKRQINPKKLYDAKEFRQICDKNIQDYLKVLERGYYQFALGELLRDTIRLCGVETE